MKSFTNFALYQVAWFAAVLGAARGSMWIGPAAMAVIVAIHLARLPDRSRELRYLLLVGLAGTIADSVLRAVGATVYPTSPAVQSLPLVPVWITALWIGFATLPRYSLAWLFERPWLAAILGAVGGPLSYLGGIRLGAVAAGSEPALTWSALAVEYAIATPLLLHFAPARAHVGATVPTARKSRNRIASLPRTAALLVVGLCVLAGLLTFGGCSSMEKSEVESRLLALEKNRPVKDAGLHVRTSEVAIAGESMPVEYRWHEAGTSGPIVVLVHGTPSSLVTWTDVVHGGPGYAGLAETCRVYALDVLGHGTTRTSVSPCSFQACADWVGGFLEMLDLRDVLLVGQSYGGEFAWRCALDNEDRVARLALMSSSGFPRRDDEWLPEEVKMREMWLARYGWLINSRERLRPAVDLHFATQSPDERIEEYFLVSENADNWKSMIDLARDENGLRSPELARLKQPTLLLWGERDVAYRPERFGKLFADTIPDARYVPVPDAGHYPHEEQPAFVAGALAEFAGAAR